MKERIKKIKNFIQATLLFLGRKIKGIFQFKLSRIALSKIKFKQKSFAISLPIILVITAGFVGIRYGAVEYYKIFKLNKEADQFTKEEKYEEAIGKLNLAQVSLFVKDLGIKKQEIFDKQEENKKLLDELSKYNQGLDRIDKGNYQEAIDLFSEIPESSFYYQKAQTKIEESKRGIVEGKLEKEQVARGAAEQKAQQEIQARKISEVKAIDETSKRVVEEAARKEAEQTSINERLAKEQQQREAAFQKERAGQEEAARKEAEQIATNERLAKEQQQREAAFQKERAGQEEKARILELAKTQPMIKAVVNGELKFYIYPLPVYAATGVSTVVEDIATILSSWSPYETTIRRVYSPNDADITISWIRDYGSEILGQAIFRAHLEVGLGSNNCLGDWRAFDHNTIKKILWHELGHSMGYGHSNNPNNIMYSLMDTRFEVESEISKVIPGGYFTTQPLCSSGGYSYSFKTDNPTTGFNLFVLLPGVDSKSFLEESGSFYLDCGAKRMQSYPGLCVVDSGAKIYIENTSASNAIKLSGKVINTDQSLWPDMAWDQNAFQYDNNQLTKYWELFH